MADKKGPASDNFMTAAEMKPLLALSKREPVQAAIGLTADGEGIILLSKKLKPKKVLATLRADAGKEGVKLAPATLRFGRAEVDTEYDAAMVRFFINKEGPGNLRAKLVEVVKRASYSKVEINIDPALEEEPEDEVEGQDATTSVAPAPPEAPPAPPPAPPAPPALDGAALATALGQLMQAIPKVAAGNAELQKTLVALATTAQASLKAKELEQASTGIDALRRALAEAMEQAKAKAPAQPGTTAPTSTGGPVAYAKSRLAWIAVRKKMETDLETLRNKLMEVYKDTPVISDLNSRYSDRVAPLLANLDEELADKLDEATNATEPAKRAKLVEESRQIIKRYQDFMASESIFAEIDSNPFVPLAVGKTMTATLATLAAAVR